MHVIRCLAVVLLVQGCLSVSAAENQTQKLNVLMIAVDDLRPELGCYGATYMHSPNIDKLAKSGVVMDRAYCQFSVCSPSRTSLLTGRRPDTTKIYDLNTHFRKTIPDVVTLPEYFKNKGYHTQGIGKVFHGTLNDPQSWTVPHWMPKNPHYRNPESFTALANARKDPKNREWARYSGIDNNGPSWEASNVSDNELNDGAIADRAIETLTNIKDKPFFLGVGFLKPHLPLVAPKKYFDLYPLDQIHLAGNPNPPEDVPPPAMQDSNELRSYCDMPKKGPIPNEKAREVIRAYRASTSFIDAQIGRVLDELDKLGLRDKTIVVLWGDHGWHLGEHGLWCKHTNFEEATRAPLVLSVPGRKAVNAHTKALVEFVDIYPTLCELCGLSLPDGLEGVSMTPLLDDPSRPWKKAAFSQYPRLKQPGRFSSILQPNGPPITMGHSMRTDRYRYTEWAEPGHEPVGVELYDHQTDPGENVNIAGKPEMKNRVAELHKQLRSGWKAARP